MPPAQPSDGAATISTAAESAPPRRDSGDVSTVVDRNALDKDEDEDKYEAGTRLRDLKESEVHQYPALKRERWW